MAVGPSAPPMIPSCLRSFPARFLTPVANPIMLKKQRISEAVFLYRSLDSKEPDWSKFQDFLKGEVRFASLYKMFPESADELLAKTEEFAKVRLNTYKRLAGK